MLHVLLFYPRDGESRGPYYPMQYSFAFNEEEFASAKKVDFMNYVGKSLSILGEHKVIIEKFSLTTLSNHDHVFCVD